MNSLPPPPNSIEIDRDHRDRWDHVDIVTVFAHHLRDLKLDHRDQEPASRVSSLPAPLPACRDVTAEDYGLVQVVQDPACHGRAEKLFDINVVPVVPAVPASLATVEPGSGRMGQVEETGLGLDPPENAGGISLADALDAFEERAAIREFEGGATRTEAEAHALREVAERFEIAPSALQAARATNNP